MGPNVPPARRAVNRRRDYSRGVNRARSILTRPAVSAVLLGALLYSLWRVPSADTSVCSVLGWTLPGLKVGKAEMISVISVYLVRDGSGFRVEDIEKSSTQGLLDAMEKNPDDVVRAILNYERRARGLYDVTWFDDEYTVWLRPFSSQQLGADESARARAAFVGWIGAKSGANQPGIAEALSEIAPNRAILNWPGIANTAFAAIGWPLFGISLGWIPRVLRDRRERRRVRVLRAGLCPRCGYAILGLKEQVCPECGKPLQI